MASFVGAIKSQFFDNNGEPLSGGSVATYVAGSVNTPIATYATLAAADAGTPANTNPIILDTRGEAVIVITAATKFVVSDSNGNQIYTVDNFEVDQTVNTGTAVQNVIDPNGNIILSYSYVNNADNYVKITNSVAGANPIIEAAGQNPTGVRILNKSAMKANAAGTQTIAAATETTVQFATEVYDKNGFWNNSTHVYTPTIPGVYAVSCALNCTVTSPINGAVSAVYVRKNATNYSDTAFFQDSARTNATGQIVAYVDMNGTTDTISIRCTQNATTAGVFTVANTSYLNICLLETT